MNAVALPDRRGLGWWHRYEVPTFLLAAAIYGGWAALLWFHQALGWWWVPPCIYLVALQFSLQHETIHALRLIAPWLRSAIAAPPLGLWLPYRLYHRGHSRHHRNRYLTDPIEDPESYYTTEANWRRLGPAGRFIMLLNLTLLGRIVIGPLIRLYKLVTREYALLARGRFVNLPIWLGHVIWLGILFTWIQPVCGVNFGFYILAVAYPAFGIGLIRSFHEHRYARLPGERTASVETGLFFGLLFLFNNLHVAHHLRPTIPWYELPRFYRTHRAKLLEHNGGFFYPGYRTIARRWLLRPVFRPVHPQHPAP